ncbi:hypothetical protein MKW98_005953, partial [Papaver atlanticum]
MAMKFNILCVSLFILFFFIEQGMGECIISDIGIRQQKVNVWQGVDEYEVEIQNNCLSCGLSNLTLGCDGFQSVESVPTVILQPLGNGECLINGGDVIFRGISIQAEPLIELPISKDMLGSG